MAISVGCRIIGLRHRVGVVSRLAYPLNISH